MALCTENGRKIVTMGTCITGLSDFEIEYREGIPKQITSRQREGVSPNQKERSLGTDELCSFPSTRRCSVSTAQQLFLLDLSHACTCMVDHSPVVSGRSSSCTVCINHARSFFLIDSRSSGQPLQLLFNCVFDHLDYVDYVHVRT